MEREERRKRKKEKDTPHKEVCVKINGVVAPERFKIIEV